MHCAFKAFYRGDCSGVVIAHLFYDVTVMTLQWVSMVTEFIVFMATELTVCVFSLFQGGWQTAELSTRAYESRPWFCDNVTGMKTIKPFKHLNYACT